jgi:hypothetical protein
MRVTIRIADREAVPVRAVPFLTNWNRWTPDVLASVFAGDSGSRALAVGKQVATFRVVDAQVVPIKQDFWANFVVEQLAAVDQRLELQRGRTALGYDEWRHEALKVLPAEAFVWLDEFADFHVRDWRQRVRLYGPYASAFPKLFERLHAFGWRCQKEPVSRSETHETEDGPFSPDLLRMAKEDLEGLLRLRHLDFAPLVPRAFRPLLEEALISAGVPVAQTDSGLPKLPWPRPVIRPVPEDIKKRIVTALREGQSENSLANETGYSRTTIAKLRPAEKADAFRDWTPPRRK